jgi:hypothetical protein
MYLHASGGRHAAACVSPRRCGHATTTTACTRTCTNRLGPHDLGVPTACSSGVARWMGLRCVTCSSSSGSRGVDGPLAVLMGPTASHRPDQRRWWRVGSHRDEEGPSLGERGWRDGGCLLGEDNDKIACQLYLINKVKIIPYFRNPQHQCTPIMVGVLICI